jgi:hypothetical protein
VPCWGFELGDAGYQAADDLPGFGVGAALLVELAAQVFVLPAQLVYQLAPVPGRGLLGAGLLPCEPVPDGLGRHAPPALTAAGVGRGAVELLVSEELTDAAGRELQDFGRLLDRVAGGGFE